MKLLTRVKSAELMTLIFTIGRLFASPISTIAWGSTICKKRTTLTNMIIITETTINGKESCMKCLSMTCILKEISKSRQFINLRCISPSSMIFKLLRLSLIYIHRFTNRCQLFKRRLRFILKLLEYNKMFKFILITRPSWKSTTSLMTSSMNVSFIATLSILMHKLTNKKLINTWPPLNSHNTMSHVLLCLYKILIFRNLVMTYKLWFTVT